MSKLQELIRSRKSAAASLIPVTVRITPEIHSYIEELTEHLGKSKQEVISTLIDEGVMIARNALDPAEESPATGRFHILNTNKRHNAADTATMLNEGIAAAFYGKWKLKIERIKKDDVVFLYENTVGIVGYGWASGNVEKREYEGNPDECYFQQLKNFVILKTPMRASEIRKLLGYDIVLLKTLMSLSEGDKILSALKAKNN